MNIKDELVRFGRDKYLVTQGQQRSHHMVRDKDKKDTRKVKQALVEDLKGKLGERKAELVVEELWKIPGNEKKEMAKIEENLDPQLVSFIEEAAEYVEKGYRDQAPEHEYAVRRSVKSSSSSKGIWSRLNPFS